MSGSTLTLDTGNTITNAGLLEATNGGVLDVQDGEIHNAGTGPGHGIAIDGTSTLMVDTVTLQLTGGGDVTIAAGSSITDDAANVDSFVTLDNIDNTISGAGTIGSGDGEFILTNESAGTIDATGTIVFDTGHSISNDGLLEATGGGTLDFQDGYVENTGTGPGYGILIDGTSTLLLDTSYMQLSGGGDLSLAAGSALISHGITTVTVDSGTFVYIPELDNIDNTISGAGTIGSGNGDLILTNESDGTIDADVSGATLSLNTGNTISNDGLLEATNGGTLDIHDAVYNTGTLEADYGGTLTVDDAVSGGGSALIDGGTLDFAQASDADVQFTSSPGGKLVLGDVHHFTGTVSGLAAGDVIDLVGIASDAISFTGDDTGLNLVYGAQPGDSIALGAGYAPGAFTLVSDGHGGTDVELTPVVTITVVTPDGLDFQNHNALVEMGSGAIQPGGGSDSFTIVDGADHLQFVLDGSHFTYGIDGSVTGGILTAFHEFTTDTSPVALADFTGLAVDAATWMTDVQDAALGNDGALNALTGSFSYIFNGGSGPDTFGSAGLADTLNGGAGNDVLDPGGAPSGSHDTVTGGAGSDTFVYMKGYGAVTITDFDQGNSGSFDASEHDKLEINGFSNANPTISPDGHGNTIVDFGSGDVLTLLGVADASQIPQSDIIGGGGNGDGGGGNGNGGPGVTTLTSVNNAGLISEDGDHFELNGGFEKGSFVGWSVTASGSSIVSVGTAYAHTGSSGAHIDSSGSDVVLSQGVGSGVSNTLDFWLKGGVPNGPLPSGITVSWDGTPISNTNFAAVGTGGGFTEYRVDNLPSAPGGAALQFTFQQGTGSYELDDVAFTSAGGPAVQTDLGNIDFQDSNSADTHRASFTPENGGFGYVGNFFLAGGNNGVTQQSDGSGQTQWEFQVDNSDLQYLAEGQTVHQLYDVTITNDNNPADTVTQTVNVTLVGHNGGVASTNYAWGELRYPAVVQDEHLFGISQSFNALSQTVVLAYAETSHYVTTDASYTTTRNVTGLDPFFLAKQNGQLALGTSTVDVPARYNMVVPNNVNSSGNNSRPKASSSTRARPIRTAAGVTPCGKSPSPAIITGTAA